jgi:hypothetical protein
MGWSGVFVLKLFLLLLGTFFAVLTLLPANHAWYFTWFIAVAMALTNLG